MLRDSEGRSESQEVTGGGDHLPVVKGQEVYLAAPAASSTPRWHNTHNTKSVQTAMTGVSRKV